MIDAEIKEPIDMNMAYWQRTIADRIKLKIDEFALSQADDGFRTHLGWSVIGHDCMRYLVYHWRWFWQEQHHARMERIFIEGHKIETELRHILKASGAQFLDTVDEDGKQIQVSDLGGHFGGSCDGVFIWPEIGLTLPTLLETKSSKAGSPFNELSTKGVIKAKPRHFVQQSGYGKGLGIRYACYITRNKNDSSIFVEIVDLDFTLADEHRNKALHILQETTLPPRISNKRNFWVCNMCSFQAGCHDNKDVVPNCRNCKNASPVDNAQWFCSHWNSIIPKEAILKGCIEWVKFGC